MKPWNNQLDNRNYLSPVGFEFTITKAPKADFFSNSASIPGINLGYAAQPTYLKDLPVPGDKLTYADFSLRFFAANFVIKEMGHKSQSQSLFWYQLCSIKLTEDRSSTPCSISSSL